MSRIVIWCLVPLAALAQNTTELDRLLKSAVEQKAVPGVVAMVAGRNDLTYRRAIGVDENAIMAIASMTKPVTSVAVMQLVESGKVKLDAPASEYLPELAKVQVLENGTLRPPKSAVTVRQLLAHSSGFAYEFMHRDIAGLVAKGSLASMMKGGAAFLAAPLVADPGTTWEYGISTDWLGRLVEKVSGMSLEDYFQRHIFQPLGMTDSTFRVRATQQSRVAPIYQRKPDGSFDKIPPMPLGSAEFLSGGGGLRSTAADYLKFARAILAGGQLGGKRILQEASVKAMGSNQIGDLTVQPFRSLIPSLATDGASLTGGLDKFGLGFAINSTALPNGRGANTMAWAGIYNTFFWIDREKGICAVLFTQILPGLDPGPRKLLEDFDRAVYAARK